MSLKSWFRKFFSSKAETLPIAHDDLWLHMMLDILPKPFFLIDRQQKRMVFTNAAARRMMGMEYEQNPASRVYGKMFSLYTPNGELVPAENLPSARTLRGEKVLGEEFLLVSGVGRFQIKVFSEDIPEKYGRPGAALIVFQDITALRSNEMELRKAQADLKEAVEIAQVGFWSVDPVNQNTYVSEQLMSQFGLTPETFTGHLSSALERIHPGDRERVEAEINKSISTGSHYQIEYRVMRVDGSIGWVEARSGQSSNPSHRFSGTTVDITERVKAREVLEQNERELRKLADSMPQIVWRADQSGSLDYFNQVWFDYCGAGYEVNQGTGWTQFVHPDDLQATGARWQVSLRTKQPYENEFRLRHHDGTYRWFVARAMPLFLEDGTVEKWYGTNTDIHEQKLMSEKLEDSRAVAERANAAKSQFLANMSHEIRTPLGAIMGFSELIKENGLGRVEREEYVSVIERNSSQLLRIIDDILDLSKVEAGMMLIENIEFSLPEALTDFSSLMGFKAREKGIKFTSRAVTPIPVMIHSDPTRLRQILMNVVGNAIKFTDAGFVELRVSYDQGFLNFEIEDTGRGISADQEQNLFQPFTQADASTTRKYGGTGLGLVLTRRLSEALGGTFTLKQSRLGEGSTFAVRIKAEAGVEVKLFSGMGFETTPARSVGHQGALAGTRILLVEDSPDNQALISIYLTRAGARVDIASDGEQGVNMALGSDYHVVLMDVQMPIMDGMTAVRKLRSSSYLKPVIALTAHAMKEERERCLRAGFSDFLSKPVNREDLINTILLNKNLKSSAIS